jgi:hypothetical protein
MSDERTPLLFDGAGSAALENGTITRPPESALSWTLDQESKSLISRTRSTLAQSTTSSAASSSVPRPIPASVSAKITIDPHAELAVQLYALHLLSNPALGQGALRGRLSQVVHIARVRETICNAIEATLNGEQRAVEDEVERDGDEDGIREQEEVERLMWCGWPVDRSGRKANGGAFLQYLKQDRDAERDTNS